MLPLPCRAAVVPPDPALRGRPLRYGEFRSADDLAAKVIAFINDYNKRAKPFRWTYDGRPATSGMTTSQNLPRRSASGLHGAELRSASRCGARLRKTASAVVRPGRGKALQMT